MHHSFVVTDNMRKMDDMENFPKNLNFYLSLGKKINKLILTQISKI